MRGTSKKPIKVEKVSQQLILLGLTNHFNILISIFSIMVHFMLSSDILKDQQLFQFIWHIVEVVGQMAEEPVVLAMAAILVVTLVVLIPVSGKQGDHDFLTHFLASFAKF